MIVNSRLLQGVLGLTDAVFRAVDKAIRATTLEKFSPVRNVKPNLVFELSF
jgi:DNA ligase 1